MMFGYNLSRFHVTTQELELLKATSNNSSASLNHTYQCPSRKSTESFLTGSWNFKGSGMEVFSFEKDDVYFN